VAETSPARLSKKGTDTRSVEENEESSYPIERKKTSKDGRK